MAAFNTVMMGVLLIAATGPQAAAVMALSLGQNDTRVVKRNKACDGSGLSSRVVLSTDADYETSRSQFASVMASSTLSNHRLSPRMIIFCTTDAHVQEAVDFAKSCDFKISVRSGGHNYAGMSSCDADSPDCIQVDLSAFGTFSVDTTTTPKRVTIGVGLTLEQVYGQLVPYGLTVPAGICKHVGVGGHFQSSAHGYIAKGFGLGLDVMVSARMVLADGQIHTINASSDSELWWALRGGGPGSWGIALDYTLDTLEDADYPYVKTFTFLYPYSRSALLLLGSMHSSLSQEIEGERDMTYAFIVHPGVLLGIPGSTNEHYIMIRAVWVGRDYGELTGALYDKYVKPWEDIPHLAFGPVTSVPLSMLQPALATEWNLGPYRYSIHAFAMKSYPGADFFNLVADELDARVAIPNFHFSWQIWGLGGPHLGSQVERNAGINAYATRHVQSWVDDWVFFLGDGLAQVAEDRIHAFRNATGHHWEEDNIAHSWMTMDTMVNNTHSGAADFARSESDFQRLQTVKTRVDPTDLFHTSMTIPVRQSASASAVGDPHLQNIHGERFDLMQPGRHTLLEIPRRSHSERTLLLVEADAQHDGPACADMYFQEVNITGAWAESKSKGGLRFSVHDADASASEWMRFGTVDLKVTRGHTQQGTRYLNFFSKHLGHAGFAVGGLLGEDDHEEAATPLKQCKMTVALLQGPGETADASRAEASLE